MTKFGETHHFEGHDFIAKIEDYLDRQVDGVVCNTCKPGDRLLQKYAKVRAEPVDIHRPENWVGNRSIYAADLLDSSAKIIRHDPKKLAAMIQKIIN
jgi:2-phospho-L-lactate transferase/gluconeogenesis factor (CofD/UPF0052 family)